MSLSHRCSFRFRLFVALALVLIVPHASRAGDSVAAKPKIRAITAFVRLDRPHYKEQIQDTLNFLRQAKATFERSGYEVQTIRITTQPFPEYTRDLSEAETLAFFRDYDALAMKEGFDASIGPAMMKDTDDPREAELLAKILAGAKTLEGSIFIGGEDGIHWKSIRAAAGVMKYLEANTPHSQGNFSFSTSSFVPDGTPFYPASYLAGEDRQFAIGLQSANVVADAFASTKSPDAAEEEVEVLANCLCSAGGKNREGNQPEYRLEIRRDRSFPSAPERHFDRRRDREFSRRAHRHERHHDRRRVNHPRAQSDPRDASGLFRIDAAYPGRFGTFATLERRTSLHRCAAFVLRGLRHRP